jgi:sigma-E factor negative regulatory protein RseA
MRPRYATLGVGVDMKERLSALMDGELSEHEQAQVLAQLASDPELAKTWERYHLIRDVLNSDLGPLVLTGLSDRIAIRVAQLPTPVPGSQRWRRPARWGGGLALAASIAALAIVSVQWIGRDVPPAQTAQVASDSAPAAELVRANVAPETANEADVARLLNTYLVEHSETAPASSIKGVMSYGRFVGYDNRP